MKASENRLRESKKERIEEYTNPLYKPKIFSFVKIDFPTNNKLYEDGCKVLFT